MSVMNEVSILDGNTFVVSDGRGDMEATPTQNHGLFLNDTRFLSRWVLTVDGLRPTLLSADDLAYFRVQFFLALATGTIYVNSKLSIVRRRSVCDGFREEIEIVNHDHQPVTVRVHLDAASDFADLFEVKDQLAKKGELYRKVDHGRLLLGYRRESFQRETVISSSMPAEVKEDGLSFEVHLEPQSSWTTSIDVSAVFLRAIRDKKPRARESLRDGDPQMGRDLAKWVDEAPRLVASWEPLANIYKRSLIDLAALRFATGITPGALPAAGLPWFMAIFGRDSLITSFQALPFAPELSATTLRTLALFQGQSMDPFRDMEPGKILHELRLGELTAFEERPHSPYYGSADGTMLFLILLEE